MEPVFITVLYVLLAGGALFLATSPFRLVWFAFRVRPVRKKYQAMVEKAPHVARRYRGSFEYTWLQQNEESLTNARTATALVACVAILWFEFASVFDGFRVNRFPFTYSDINDFVSAVGQTVIAGVQAKGLEISSGLAVAACLGGFATAWLLDSLTGLVASAVRPTTGKRSRRRARTQRLDPSVVEDMFKSDAAEAPAATLVGIAVELGLARVTLAGELIQELEILETHCTRRLRDSPAVAERARHQLELIGQARVLLKSPGVRKAFNKAKKVPALPPPAEPPAAAAAPEPSATGTSKRKRKPGGERQGGAPGSRPKPRPVGPGG